MMRINRIISLSIILMLLIGCNKETIRLDDYFINIATIKKVGEQYRFELDNGHLLIPIKTEYNGKEGQRVILNYVPLNGDTIKINQIKDIFTDNVHKENSLSELIKDPIKIQSVWVGGDYLNLIIETYFLSKPHKVALIQDITSPTINLYFSHSKEDDPHGYPQTMYMSFLITSIRDEGQSLTPFTLFIETYEGQREIPLVLK